MNYAHGDPNALSAGTGLPTQQAKRFSAGDVVLERLVVHNGPARSSFPSFVAFKDALFAAPNIIGVDLASFNILGVDILPLDAGDTLVTWDGKNTAPAGQSSYVVDLVYTPVVSETSWIDPASHASAAAKSFKERGFRDIKSEPVVEFVSLRTLDDSQLTMTWAASLPLSLVNAGEIIEQGPAFTSGYSATPPTWGKQMAVGLADFPSLLSPLVGTGLVSGNGGGGSKTNTPTFKWPTASGEAPSNQNLLVWALFAVGGAMLARQVWRSFR